MLVRSSSRARPAGRDRRGAARCVGGGGHRPPRVHLGRAPFRRPDVAARPLPGGAVRRRICGGLFLGRRHVRGARPRAAPGPVGAGDGRDDGRPRAHDDEHRLVGRRTGRRTGPEPPRLPHAVDHGRRPHDARIHGARPPAGRRLDHPAGRRRGDRDRNGTHLHHGRGGPPKRHRAGAPGCGDLGLLFFRNIGATLGVALMGATLTARLGVRLAGLEEGARHLPAELVPALVQGIGRVFWLGVGATVLALLATFFLPDGTPRSAAAPASDGRRWRSRSPTGAGSVGCRATLRRRSSACRRHRAAAPDLLDPTGGSRGRLRYHSGAWKGPCDASHIEQDPDEYRGGGDRQRYVTGSRVTGAVRSADLGNDVALRRQGRRHDRGAPGGPDADLRVPGLGGGSSRVIGYSPTAG